MSSTTNRKETFISIAGQHPTIGLTVNNGGTSYRQAVSAITRQVLVTPLRSSTTSRPTVNTAQPSLHFEQHWSAVKVDTVLLKAVNKKGKKDPKTFTLRNVDQSAVLSCDDLQDVKIITKNLRYDITSGHFDVGYIQGSSVVRIRSNEDLAELWSLLKKARHCGVMD